LREEEWLIYEWSPIHLRNLLNQWYFRDGKTEVGALKVWQDTCHYLYLPRLINDRVFRDAIAKGIESEDYFGFAAGKDGDRYLGFVFGKSTPITLDESSLLIEREAAMAWRAKMIQTTKKEPVGAPYPSGSNSSESSPRVNEPSGSSLTGGSSTVPASRVKKCFYGTVSLDPIKAKMDFATLMDEVVQPFTSKLGVDVTISVEIQAQSKDGFDETLQRNVKENCNVLKFGSAEFEDGE